MSASNIENDVSATGDIHFIMPSSEHTHTIILLHGRNSTGPDFAGELFEGLNNNAAVFEGCKWVLPTAPATWSAQFQEDLTEWFDLASTSNPYNEPERQVAGLEASVDRINAIIDEELKHVAASNIILGGMSQGYATSAHVLLTRKERLGGLLGISGWLPFCLELSKLTSTTASTLPKYMADLGIKNNADMPMLLTHSKDDEVIEFEFGRQAGAVLRELGLNPMCREYEEGGHEIEVTRGYGDIEQFLVGIIGR
jgi:lysophospholipase-2